MLEGQ